MPWSGDGVPRQRRSIRPRSCSTQIDWVAEELHDELPIPSKHFEAKQQKRTEWEDDILIQRVNLYGAKKWSAIACAMPGRSGMQCRDSPWSELEEMTLIKAHQIHGNKWCELAKLFPGRTGKAIKNYWVGPMKRKLKSYLARGLSEQLPYRPNDQLIPDNRASSALENGQDLSKNIQVSSDLPIRPKSEQGLPEPSGIECVKGSAANFVIESQTVDSPIALSNTPLVTEEKLVLSSSSVDQKVSFAAENFPRSLQTEDLTNFFEVPQNSVNTGFSPADNLPSSSDHSDEICTRADAETESQGLHLSNIADLLDMSYCGSLMIIPPESPNEGNSVQGKCDIS
ncbi:hypothetical protein ACP70R_029219 [Stipagrostis hirtigluma subsp. patula]